MQKSVVFKNKFEEIQEKFERKRKSLDMKQDQRVQSLLEKLETL